MSANLQTMTLCLQCGEKDRRQWICQKCSSTCHSGHSQLPWRQVNEPCYCCRFQCLGNRIVERTFADYTLDGSSQLDPELQGSAPASTGERKKWDSNDRIFDRLLETASNAPSWEVEPRSSNTVTTRRMNRQTDAGVGVDEYICARQLNDMDGTAASAVPASPYIDSGNRSYKRSNENPRNDFDLYNTSTNEFSDAEY